MGVNCSRDTDFDSDSDESNYSGEATPERSGSLRTARGYAFNTLLEAFEHCDPDKTGYINCHHRFADIAHAFTNAKGDEDSLWARLDQDGNGRVNFPEFVEWAELFQVHLPVGLRSDDEVGPEGISFPHTWKGSTRDPTWNRREMVTDGQVLAELRQLLDVSYKRLWTRDRTATGVNRVPARFELTRAMRSENFADWRRYYLKRHQIAHDCNTGGYFERFAALTARAPGIDQRHRLRADSCNEWLLFHGTSTSSAERICSGDFTMHLAGSATGSLYGRGIYFADSITKADEYSKPDAHGNCCVLVCRVVGGRVMYNDEVSPDSQRLQDAVLGGSYHCILGDREKCRGTFKEYVIFDADQVYVEYALFYKRIYHAL